MTRMAEFSSLDAFQKFAARIKETAKGGDRARVVGCDEETGEFLRVVLETSKTRRRKLRKGSVLYRAQLAYDTFSERLGGHFQKTRKMRTQPTLTWK